MLVNEIKHEEPGNITPLTLVVEIGLALIALAIGLFLGHSPLASVEFSAAAISQNMIAIAWGVLATIPMMLMLLVVERSCWGPLIRLRNVVFELIVPFFRKSSIVELALIAIAAGIGEEMLFRGIIQALLSEWLRGPYSVLVALLVASAIFGACHWITNTYAVLATLIGLLLGGLFVVTENLLAPITAHALYDFVALIYLVKWKSDRLSTNLNNGKEKGWPDQ